MKKSILIVFAFSLSLFNSVFAMPVVTYLRQCHPLLLEYDRYGVECVIGRYYLDNNTIYIEKDLDVALEDEVIEHENGHYVVDEVMTPGQIRAFEWMYRKNPYFPTDYSKKDINENFAEIYSLVARGGDYPENFQTRMIERIIENGIK